MMVRKKFHLLAALAMVLSGCSEVQTDELALPRQDAAECGVVFDAYTQRGIDTRSGYAGPLTTSEGTDNLQTEGFGVFAYYTDNGEYSQRSTPNFMYNQKVAYNSVAGVWDYTPVKYWPNEYGTDAGSADMDKLSFFAYAPFVSAAPVTGRVDDATYGITGFTRNTDPGDPCVRYIASFDAAKSVDLCWGGVGTVADGTWPVVQDNGVRHFAAGLPWINVERPASATGQRLKFLFKHALSQLNVQIDADPDIVVPNETTQIGTLPDGSTVETGGTKTKVYVRSISFGGFAMKGMLNLNNQVSGLPRWLDYDFADKGIEGATVTIHDGLRDGREGTGATSTNETVTGLNPALISDNGNTTAGVTHELKNLFASSSLTDPVYVIPTGDDLTVSITYDVETASENLAGYLSDGVTHGYSAENTITKTVALGSGGALALAAGRKYTVKLHLGMNSLKFDASVGDWEKGGTGVELIVSGPAGFSVDTPFGIATNGSAQFTAHTIPATAVTWSSSDPVNFPVDQTGLVTASADAAGKSATITVTTSEGQTVTFTVFGSIPATGISLNKTVLEMNIYDADETLVATVTPADATDKSVTWTTSDAAVATVDANGKVHPVGEGTATITAKVTAYPTLTATCSVTVVSDITGMKADAQSSNPLWKVAQYNVAQNKTSFVSAHSTASQYVFSWADANSISISGYHLPTWAEQVKIIPSTNASGNGTDWFSAVMTTPTAMDSNSGKGWYTASSANNNVYAVRIVDGVLTAWHYQWVTSPCNGLQIDSYVLAYHNTGVGDTWTDAEMQAILALLPSSSVWTKAAANESPESSSSTSSRCTRILPACGVTDAAVGSGVATKNYGTDGNYWSATASGESNAFRWGFYSDRLYESQSAKGVGFSVRLFHN